MSEWLSEGVLVAVVGAVGLFLTGRFGQTRPFQNPREEIERDLKILPELDEASEARRELKASIENRVVLMVKPVGTSRNWYGIVLALIILGLSGYGTVRFAMWGGWWWFIAAPLAVFTLACFSPLAQAWRKAPRTQSGSLIG